MPVQTSCERFALESNTIAPKVAAHVLYTFAREGCEAGSFFRLIIAALCAADPSNFVQLGQAYPDYADAVHLAKHHNTGLDVLRAICLGGGR